MTNWRIPGYAVLRGHGLEIGALHQPAPLPAECEVEYCDVITRDQALTLFPEVPPNLLVDPTHVSDLDTDGLRQFTDAQFDFVILNHVIEHIANPMQAVIEIFRVTKYGGHVVISCPDKRFTFDRDRPLTPILHLVAEYEHQVDTVTDDHYLDFLTHVHPECQGMSDAELHDLLVLVRARHEHAHVWDSNSFHAFLVTTLSIAGENTACVHEVTGDESHLEYFSVWRRDQKAAVNRVRDVTVEAPNNGRQHTGEHRGIIAKRDRLIALGRAMAVSRHIRWLRR